MMPGIINTHIHVDSDVNYEFGKTKFVWIMKTNMLCSDCGNPQYENDVTSDVTVVRNVGTARMTDIEIARMQREGSVEGPMMIASGAAFS